MMLMPGFVESYVSARIRLMFALALSLVATPVVSVYLPPMPASLLGAAVLVGGEVVIGIFMGRSHTVAVGELCAWGSAGGTVCGRRYGILCRARFAGPADAAGEGLFYRDPASDHDRVFRHCNDALGQHVLIPVPVRGQAAAIHRSELREALTDG